MKKTTKTVLILCLSLLVSAFSLTSCDRENAFSLMEDAVKKTVALNDLSCDMTLNTDVRFENVSYAVPISYRLLATDLQTDAPRTLSHMETELLGQTVATEIYGDGDYYYVDLPGKTFRIPSGNPDACQYDVTKTVMDMLKILPEDCLKDTQIETGADGEKSFSASLDEEAFKKTFSDFSDQIRAASSEGFSGTDVGIRDASVSLTIDRNGYIASYGMNFSMEVTTVLLGNTVSGSCKVEAKTELHEPGKSVSVLPPDGYESYEAYDPNSYALPPLIRDKDSMDPGFLEDLLGKLTEKWNSRKN